MLVLIICAPHHMNLICLRLHASASQPHCTTRFGRDIERSYRIAVRVSFGDTKVVIARADHAPGLQGSRLCGRGTVLRCYRVCCLAADCTSRSLHDLFTDLVKDVGFSYRSSCRCNVGKFAKSAVDSRVG